MARRVKASLGAGRAGVLRLLFVVGAVSRGVPCLQEAAVSLRGCVRPPTLLTCGVLPLRRPCRCCSLQPTGPQPATPAVHLWAQVCQREPTRPYMRWVCPVAVVHVFSSGGSACTYSG